MTTETIAEQSEALAVKAAELARQAAELAQTQSAGGEWSMVALLMVFMLACFVGYYVVWKVTPALHSPLMSVTNAISSVVIIGAILAAGLEGESIAKVFGFLAVTLASINIFGGFVVTDRMLSMFKGKKKTES